MTEEVVSLKKTDAGNLASNERMMVVGELERELLRKMPASDACSWDRTGMLVGNPMDTVRGVAVALDPTIHAVEEAHAHGANVLLTITLYSLTRPTHLCRKRQWAMLLVPWYAAPASWVSAFSRSILLLMYQRLVLMRCRCFCA